MIEITQEWLFNETKDFLSKGEKVIMRGRGKSMNPYLREGKDSVVLSPFVSEDLKAGTIVLFSYRNKYILHRIIGRKGNHFVIQGDGVYKKVELVPDEDIIAVVRTVIRQNGKEVSTQSLGARLYWRCWSYLHPIRKYLLFIYRFIPALKRRASKT